MLKKLISGNRDPLQFLPKSNLGRCLDLGCGTGRISQHIDDRSDELVSVDADSSRVRAASSSQSGDFLITDGCRLPFQSNTFDTVVSYTVIEHIPEEKNAEFLSEIRRVLKSDGLAYVVNDTFMYRVLRRTRLLFPNRGPDPTHINMIRPRTLVRRMRSAGFEIQEWYSSPISYWFQSEIISKALSDVSLKGHVIARPVEGREND